MTSPNLIPGLSPSPPQGRWSASPLLHSIPDITFSIQNCNSLNISTNCDKHLAKLIAITALCTDVIFLSDLRLHDDTEAADNISKIFLCNSKRNYNFHYNSSCRNRGVGILIACNLPCKILDTFCDNSSNILGLTLASGNNIFSVCAIYGPNSNEKKFFNDLALFLDRLEDVPVVIGGDWNATYSQLPAGHNPDIINMASPPSLIRSGWLWDVCSNYHLLDPFRAFHPTRKEFTLFPHGARKNRSRIDFFLITNHLLNKCRSCNISPWLSISNFDHKSITLDCTTEKKCSKLVINRTIISNPRTDDVVLGAFADSYLAHANPGRMNTSTTFVPRWRSSTKKVLLVTLFVFYVKLMTYWREKY
jgi:exonuclease III